MTNIMLTCTIVTRNVNFAAEENYSTTKHRRKSYQKESGHYIFKTFVTVFSGYGTEKAYLIEGFPVP